MVICKERNHWNVYGSPTISLQTRQSNVRKVTLRKVSLLTSGVYRCEVTSKLSPAGIDSEVREDRMVVLGETF